MRRENRNGHSREKELVWRGQGLRNTKQFVEHVLKNKFM